MPDTHLGRLARDIHEAKAAGDFNRAARLSDEFVTANDLALAQARGRSRHFLTSKSHVVVGDHEPEPRLGMRRAAYARLKASVKQSWPCPGQTE